MSQPLLRRLARVLELHPDIEPVQFAKDLLWLARLLEPVVEEKDGVDTPPQLQSENRPVANSVVSTAQPSSQTITDAKHPIEEKEETQQAASRRFAQTLRVPQPTEEENHHYAVWSKRFRNLRSDQIEIVLNDALDEISTADETAQLGVPRLVFEKEKIPRWSLDCVYEKGFDKQWPHFTRSVEAAARDNFTGGKPVLRELDSSALPSRQNRRNSTPESLTVLLSDGMHGEFTGTVKAIQQSLNPSRIQLASPLPAELWARCAKQRLSRGNLKRIPALAVLLPSPEQLHLREEVYDYVIPARRKPRELSEERRLARFERTASPEAHRALRLMAALQYFTLKLLRFVLERGLVGQLSRREQQIVMVEVRTSGLVEETDAIPDGLSTKRIKPETGLPLLGLLDLLQSYFDENPDAKQQLGGILLSSSSMPELSEVLQEKPLILVLHSGPKEKDIRDDLTRLGLEPEFAESAERYSLPELFQFNGLLIVGGTERTEGLRRSLALAAVSGTPTAVLDPEPHSWRAGRKHAWSLFEVTSSLTHVASFLRGADLRLPGAKAFSEREASLYFGRESEVQEAARTLLRGKNVRIVGPAGSGKTSFLRAGLTPSLRSQPGVWPVSVDQLFAAALILEEYEEFRIDRLYPSEGVPHALKRWAELTDLQPVIIHHADQRLAGFGFEEIYQAIRRQGCAVAVEARVDARLEREQSLNLWPLGVGDWERILSLQAKQFILEVEPQVISRMLSDYPGEASVLLAQVFKEVVGRALGTGRISAQHYRGFEPPSFLKTLWNRALDGCPEDIEVRIAEALKAERVPSDWGEVEFEWLDRLTSLHLLRY